MLINKGVIDAHEKIYRSGYEFGYAKAKRELTQKLEVAKKIRELLGNALYALTVIAYEEGTFASYSATELKERARRELRIIEDDKALQEWKESEDE